MKAFRSITYLVLLIAASMLIPTAVSAQRANPICERYPNLNVDPTVCFLRTIGDSIDLLKAHLVVEDKNDKDIRAATVSPIITVTSFGDPEPKSNAGGTVGWTVHFPNPGLMRVIIWFGSVNVGWFAVVVTS